MVFGLAFFGVDTFANTAAFEPKIWTEICPEVSAWSEVSSSNNAWSGTQSNATAWAETERKEPTIKRCQDAN